MFEIRKDKVGQGPVKLTAERQKYFGLVSQGVSHSGACAIAGVGEGTGRVWRAGRQKDPQAGLRPRAGRGPRESPMPRLLGPAGSRFLDLQERITIFTMLENKQGLRTIARGHPPRFHGRSGATPTRGTRTTGPTQPSAGQGPSLAA
jgi:hypothetical protein